VRINCKWTQSLVVAICGLAISGCVSGGTKNNEQRYKERPGWRQLNFLANDDCNTWKSNGKSLLDWKGEKCGAEGLIKVINQNPDKIPLFYAAYHEYGSEGVRAIDVSDSSKMNYLNYAYDISRKVSSVIAGIYADYQVDRSAMGLLEVPREVFVAKLTDFASQKDSLYQQMNEVAKREYGEKRPSKDEKLGVNFKATCGPFVIDLSPSDGWARINGAKPESQKIIPLGAGGLESIKMEWTVATNQPGRWVGLEYIKRNGKAILNAQWLQANMDAPRQYASYDCVKVK
jgi:hypothetical protein